MKNKIWILGCLALVILALLAGAALLFLIPGVDQQVPPGISSISVTLSAPQSEVQVPLYQFTTVVADALGAKPIAALELWIDGTPSETKNAPAGSTLDHFSAFWTWTPAREGEHTLIVRALDADHNTGMSNIVRVTVSKDANVVPKVSIQTNPGDTVPSLARNSKTSPQQIIDLNPQINPTGPITPGQTITVPIPLPPLAVATPEPAPASPPDPPGNPNQPPADNPPNKYIIWWNQNIFKKIAPVQPPAAPGLAASVGAGKCAINLYIYDKSDNEDGFSIYQLDPVSLGFKRIAMLDAHSGSQAIHYVNPVSSGKYLFYVSSFNAAGESSSKLAQAAIIEPCGDPQSSLQLNNAKITVNQPVDKIYCYLQVDNGIWTRVPPGDDTFIEPSKPGEFDLSQYLKSLTPSPPPPQITLDIECWGWHGSALVYLGQANETIKQGQVQLKAPSWQLIGSLDIQKQLLKGGIPDPALAPPKDAELTRDLSKCLSHTINPQQCLQFIDSGLPVLIWWDDDVFLKGCLPIGKCLMPQGFNVYIQYPGQPQPVLYQSINSPDVAVAAMTVLPLPVQAPAVAFVRAFNGSSESTDSNMVPLTMKLTTVELAPAKMTWTYGHDESGCPSGVGPGGPSTWGNGPIWGSYNPAPGPVVVGFEFHGDPCDYANVVDQGLVWFDLSKISHSNIVQAVLKYAWKGSYFRMGTGFASLSGYSCTNQLMLAKVDWRGGALPIYADPYLVIPWAEIVDIHAPPQYSRDVTTAVKEWVQGSRPNYGFVLIGPYQDVSQEWGDQSCITAYGDFTLQVSDYEP